MDTPDMQSAIRASGFRRLVSFLGGLMLERRGNVLMMVGLAAPLIFGAAGFAVDYGYSSYLKRSLNQAADAASLAATSQSAAASGGGYGNVVWLRQVGLNEFAGNAAKLSVSVTPTLTVTPNGTGGVVATASYTYTVPTFFSSLIGIPNIPIAGSSTATANPITYIDYYILVDISQSMGIGSTQADMAQLYAATGAYGHSCVFGCHVAKNNESQINEVVAHSANPRITLRIDAAINAIKNIIIDAQTAAGSAKNIRIGLYTMSDDPVSGKQLNVIAAPSSNYSDLTTLAATITLGGNVGGGFGDTNYGPQMSQFNALLPTTNGLGLSSSTAKNYVFIISDGMSDINHQGSCYYGHCSSAMDPNNCTQFKTKATVGTIYTTYLPIYKNNDSNQGYDPDYQSLVLPYNAQIAPNMQSCATTSDYYYQATDGPAIDTAMKALFQSTLKTARLIQ